jgi:hypothetical protein
MHDAVTNSVEFWEMEVTRTNFARDHLVANLMKAPEAILDPTV